MDNFQIYLIFGIFAVVVLAIAFDLIDMALAGLLGVSLMLLFGVLDAEDISSAVRESGGPLSLLFGGMVVVRVLSDTGIFERLGILFLRATGGSGKRFLLLLIALVAPVCAFLPNATTVILLAPVIVRVSRALEIDFVGPLVITAIISNSAGLLTLVGDPATFLVGSSIGMTFGQYLRQVSLGGLLSVLVVIPFLPWLMPEIWSVRRELPLVQSLEPIRRPGFVVLALSVLLLMVLLFMFGENLPARITPPAVSIIAATLALLVIYSIKIEPLDDVIHAVDWKTLIFIATMFCLVEGITKTGFLQAMSLKLHGWFGMDYKLVALALMAGVGTLSSLLENIPVVASSLIMTKGYLVAVEAVPEIALAGGFYDWPAATMPVFIAMMFGATLGGNATLIGGAANIVTAGICEANGQKLSFVRFMRYGLPITFVQLAVSAAYVLIRG